MSEPKVTECWVEKTADTGHPTLEGGYEPASYMPWQHPAILIWREDYDAMRKELDELRAYKERRLTQDRNLRAALETLGYIRYRNELIKSEYGITTEAHDDKEAK